MARVQFPDKLQFLFRPARYKVAHGGRGSAKSWSFSRYLLIDGTGEPQRMLCARELQTSIAESVHELLRQQISLLGMNDFYSVLNNSITGENGTEFMFAGLRHNVNKIRSIERVKKCWVEEAVNVTRNSWETLIPTIREDDSEILISFNPELEDDETYKRFVLDPPAGAVVERITWRDNPWFPKVLDDERRELQRRDPDAYLTVWEGHCRQTLDGAIYAAELRAATEENRICRVPYERSKPVHTFWDIGFRDYTSIWFVQRVGFETRVIDFYQSNQKTIDHYLEILQGRRYVYGTDWLPHDAKSGTIASHGKGFADLMRAAGRTVEVLQRTSVAEGINAVRQMFPNTYIDKERCADGLQSLRRYRYKVDADTGKFSRLPDHDDSDAADAFRGVAMGTMEPRRRRIKDTAEPPEFAGSEAGWMR